MIHAFSPPKTENPFTQHHHPLLPGLHGPVPFPNSQAALDKSPKRLRVAICEHTAEETFNVQSDSVNQMPRIDSLLPTWAKLLSKALHDNAAAATLLWRVRVLSFRNGAPDTRHHVIPGAVAVRDDAVKTRELAPGPTIPGKRFPHLLAAWLTGMRSRSRSSRSRELSSVSLRSFRSAMLCLVFLICDGSPTSREVY